jgi:hypothetical protein
MHHSHRCFCNTNLPVNLIYRSAAIWLRYVVLCAQRSIVSSASVSTDSVTHAKGIVNKLIITDNYYQFNILILIIKVLIQSSLSISSSSSSSYNQYISIATSIETGPRLCRCHKRSRAASKKIKCQIKYQITQSNFYVSFQHVRAVSQTKKKNELQPNADTSASKTVVNNCVSGRGKHVSICVLVCDFHISVNTRI